VHKQTDKNNGGNKNGAVRTYMAKPSEVERKWYVEDATDYPMGRLSYL